MPEVQAANSHLSARRGVVELLPATNLWHRQPLQPQWTACCPAFLLCDRLDGLSVGCRVDMFVVCEPGTYQLQTGQGPLSVDPGCASSHCELLNQTTLATLEVVRACSPT